MGIYEGIYFEIDNIDSGWRYKVGLGGSWTRTWRDKRTCEAELFKDLDKFNGRRYETTANEPKQESKKLQTRWQNAPQKHRQ